MPPPRKHYYTVLLDRPVWWSSFVTPQVELEQYVAYTVTLAVPSYYRYRDSTSTAAPLQHALHPPPEAGVL